jgi:cytochrome d ubiquinol oxidase subunit II
VHDRARRIGHWAGLVSLALFAIGGLWVAFGGIGLRITSAVLPNGPSNPMRTTSIHQSGAWLINYGQHPWMLIAPLLGFAGAALALLGIRYRREVAALTGSSLSAVGIIATVGLSMFPYILPSTVDAHSSLTVWNASSTAPTLFIMLIATAIFLPLILLYTAWVYRVMWGRVTSAEVATNPDFY